VAVTTLEQEFRNPNPQRLEGTFLFPVPKGAQLDRFTLEIDGKSVDAELLEATKARQIYEDIVRRAKDPALLEYAGQDLFKVRLFPIEGNARKRITVRYTQLLAQDSGMIGYTLPLDTAKYSSTPIKTLSVKIDLESTHPIQTLYSPTHNLEIRQEGTQRATVGLESSDLKPDTDLALYFGTQARDVGVHLLAYREPDRDGYFLLLATPGMDVPDEQVAPKDVVFMLDTSGSMSGAKIEQARKALAFCVEHLNENDHFEIIRFSTEVEPLFRQLVPADREHRAQALRFVRGLEALGGTAIDAALKQALDAAAGSIPEAATDDHSHSPSDRPSAIIFLTDGLPTVGVTSESRILDHVKERSRGHARIFCFGIGTDVNTRLLDTITEHTRATSQYVLPDEDLEVKVSNFYSKIKDPVLANPALRFEGGPRITRTHPAELPDLFRGQQLVVAGRYEGSGRGTVLLEGTVNRKQQSFEYPVAFPERAVDHDFIPRLWANRHVGYLLDQIRLHGENPELKEEVVELARQYAIVTPYTAYLILEDETQRRVPATVQSLPQLQQDTPAREQIHRLGASYGRVLSGDLAVSAARANTAFRSASTLSEVSSGALEAQKALALTATPSATREATVTAGGGQPSTLSAPTTLNQQSQFVGGRTFFLNDGRWVDSQVQQHPNARRVKLQFGSPDYFHFAATHPEARRWLAQGTRVAFILGDTLYEVSE
jgi:Ca-activated chloride channel family protein